jgi:hypothetical protein
VDQADDRVVRLDVDRLIAERGDPLREFLVGDDQYGSGSAPMPAGGAV